MATLLDLDCRQPIVIPPRLPNFIRATRRRCEGWFGVERWTACRRSPAKEGWAFGVFFSCGFAEVFYRRRFFYSCPLAVPAVLRAAMQARCLFVVRTFYLGTFLQTETECLFTPVHILP